MAGLVITTEDFGIGMTEYECVGNLGIIAQSGTKASIAAAVACGGRFTVRQFGVGFGSRDLGSDCARWECTLGDEVQLIEKAGQKEVIDFDGVTRPRLGEIIVCMRRAAARYEPRSSLFSWQVLFCIVCFSLCESIIMFLAGRFCCAVTELCERLRCALLPAEGGCPTLGSLLASRFAPVAGLFPPWLHAALVTARGRARGGGRGNDVAGLCLWLTRAVARVLACGRDVALGWASASPGGGGAPIANRCVQFVFPVLQ